VRALFSAMRHDGWYNVLTGIGDPLRDKAASGSYSGVPALTDAEAVDLYRGDDIAQKVVAKLPAEACRSGFNVEHPEAERIMRAWRAFRGPRDVGLDSIVSEAWTWGRLFGQCAIWPVTDDGASSDQPLRPDTVRAVRAWHVIDKRYLTPEGVICSDVRSPDLGLPERWRWTPPQFGQSIVIHSSRLIFWHGTKVPGPEFANASAGQSRAYCDDSVLLAPYETLRSAGMAWGAVASTISDAGQAVFRMGGLFDLIMRNQGETLNNRMTTLDMTRSVARMLVIDKDSEDFERQAFSFAGYEGIMVRFMERLAAAADMPLTVLFGVSPAGLNATGESDIRLFYDRVSSVRTEILKPKLERMLAILSRANGVDPSGLEVTFPPLWQPGPKEAEEIRTSEVNRMAAGVEAGLWSIEAAQAWLAKRDGHPDITSATGTPEDWRTVEAFAYGPTTSG
jgi:phage-related protein (TIGR01555 family)